MMAMIFFSLDINRSDVGMSHSMGRKTVWGSLQQTLLLLSLNPQKSCSTVPDSYYRKKAPGALSTVSKSLDLGQRRRRVPV
jgi:hypothetical protein